VEARTLTDHQPPEDRGDAPEDPAAVSADVFLSPEDLPEGWSDAVEPGDGPDSSPFIAPPGVPAATADPLGAFDVSGNGHHASDQGKERSSKRYGDWVPGPPDTPKEGPDELDELEAIPVREDLPPDKQLQALLMTVVTEHGSDLHLVAGAPPFVRKNGRLIAAPGWEPLTPDAVETMVSGILTERQAERLREEMELNTAHSLPDARFRVNVHFQRGSMAAAFHLIPYRVRTVEELGLPPVVEELARLRSGLVLVAGPCGSGKSTTLAALVDVVNSDVEAHILTVEDPIEILHRHKRGAVSQREVGPDTRSFARAVEEAMRQDPDVILVGELRDTETIAAAITAAEAGHLVFASLHTHDAAQTVDRIVDVFPPYQQQQIRVQLSLTLQGVVAQQLVPTPNGDGRVAVCEILMGTPPVRTLIKEGKSEQLRSAILSGRKVGMVTMDAALAALMHEGRISRDTAFQYAHSPEHLSKQLSSGYAGGLPTVAG
jgi:twitching motility protein PilT